MTPTEIIEMLGAGTPRPPDLAHTADEEFKMKAELVLTYGALRKQQRPKLQDQVNQTHDQDQDQNLDAEWNAMIQNGTLKQALETAFGEHNVAEDDVSQSAPSMKALLLATLSLWESSV